MITKFKHPTDSDEGLIPVLDSPSLDGSLIPIYINLLLGLYFHDIFRIKFSLLMSDEYGWSITLYSLKDILYFMAAASKSII
jgi:hypothetical protein